jgi:hypothetical protein
VPDLKIQLACVNAVPVWKLLKGIRSSLPQSGGESERFYIGTSDQQLAISIQQFPLSRVIPSPTPRMATPDPFHRFPRAANRPVFCDRIDCVLAARRVIAAMPAHELSECGAIEQDDMN